MTAAGGISIYFYGDRTGGHIKIGKTGGPLARRRKQFEGAQHTTTGYVLLAAVMGAAANEGQLIRAFAHAQVDPGGPRKDIFRPAAELVEYINWLRQQWWTTLSEDAPVLEVVDADRWWPTPDRRVRRADDDSQRLFDVRRAFHGDLAGTPWDWMATPEQIGEDYYTPAEIVQAAATAMGGIDIDLASHWVANRVHRIPVYYHLHRSAFENPWSGRLWLNPPYGDNAPWFKRIVECWERREFEQLCMLSPAWAFSTQIARPFMSHVSASILFSPTPKFWGNPNGVGTNHPTMVVYLGHRAREFLDAFAPFGIPLSLAPLAEVAS